MLDFFKGLFSPKPSGQKATKVVNRPPIKKSASADVTKFSQTRSTGSVQLPTFIKITSPTEIPVHSGVLSGKDNKSEFQIKSDKLDNIIILKISDESCALILNEIIVGTPYFFALQSEIKERYNIVFYGEASRGLISGFYTSSEVQEAKKDSAHIQELENLVVNALLSEASDIHILIHDKGAGVRLRIHGGLERIAEWSSRDYALQFARTLHAVADEDSKPQTFSENSSVQMSISRTMPNGQRVKLRVQTTVAYPDGGLEIVMRVLKVGSTAKVKSFSELGYEDHHIEMLNTMLSTPSGVVIIAGTTGSGKSTTLQTMSDIVQEGNDGLKLVSVEDPPEYVLRNVTQIPVVRRKGDDRNPFAQAMRDAMRLDPDIVIVGEVRDPESAECLTAIVQSGHKVLTTIHADSTFAIIGRLQKMGLDNYTMSSRGFISGLIYQKLVRVMCPNCKIPYSPEKVDKRLAERIKQVTFPEDSLFLVNKEGCECCNSRGVIGRTVCAEMVRPDRQILDFFRENNPNSAYQYWRDKRRNLAPGAKKSSMLGVTALEHGIMKMRKGMCSPHDVETDLGPLNGADENEMVETSESDEGELL